MSALLRGEPRPAPQTDGRPGPDRPSPPTEVPSLTRVLAALLLFGVSFGYVEAAVVVYLRALYEPVHQRLHPGRAPGDLFPVIRLDQLEAEGPEHLRRLAAELAREAMTLAMLA